MVDESSLLCFLLQFTHYGVPLDPVNATMVTTTVIVVLFSTLVSLSPSNNI